MATTNVLLLWIRVDSDKEGWKTGMGRDKEGSRGKGHGVVFPARVIFKIQI